MLDDVDLRARLDRDAYRERFPRLREKLRRLQYDLRDAEIATIVVFEGWGASGKGEVIQQLTEGLDPRMVRAYRQTPPSELEERYHWLWRYQIRLPEDGHMTLFDNAWYRRVLYDRVQKVVPKKVWRAAYEQMNEFERWLTDDGQIVIKVFFHLGEDEQKKRLRKMREDPFENWKVDKGDRHQSRRYERWREAADDMLAATHTRNCPWTIVAATDERYARVKVFEALVERMSAALARRRQAPALVSRTRLAADATRGVREKQARESLSRVETVAREAGLPLPAKGRRKR
jgi:polyphosphate kinase 2 (PPK2 family)